MKILHCCLAQFYIDNYSYQENILPRLHKQAGHEVEIVASTETFINNNALGYTSPGNYKTEDGIVITRLPYRKFLPHFLMKKLRIYKNVNKVLERFNPNIIFIHDCQFLDTKIFANYAKKNPDVKIFVDCHADFSNSARSWVSKNILHRILYKHSAKKIEPYTTKFYGVLPARVDFLTQMYDIPKEKVELLVMGAEDEKVLEAQNSDTKNLIRKKYGINSTDFLIMSGGKIDYNKPQTLLLMKSVKLMKNSKVKLIIFGSVAKEYKEQMLDLLSDNVKFIGWVDSKESYKYFNAADLVVFPGLHSVFWEQVVGLGKPSVFKHIEGFEHIDLGGNCRFLYEDSVEELTKVITEIVSNKEILDEMKHVAEIKGMEKFSYKRIAEKSIS